MAENQEKDMNQDVETEETVTEETVETPVDEETSAEETAAEDAVEEPVEEVQPETGKKDKKDAQIAELKDRLVRQMAEFDNYRKRTDKEKKQNYEIGASDIIVKILPVVDNFERGLNAASEEDKSGSFAQGIDMIYKQLTKALEDTGVTVIEAVGQPFDPMLHNAVMQQESDEYESGIVMQELQKGYKYKERVIRHSMVMVAK